MWCKKEKTTFKTVLAVYNAQNKPTKNIATHFFQSSKHFQNVCKVKKRSFVNVNKLWKKYTAKNYATTRVWWLYQIPVFLNVFSCHYVISIVIVPLSFIFPRL